jgi:hypothetical protein
VFSLEADEDGDGIVVLLEACGDRPRLTARVPAQVIAEARQRAERAEPESAGWWALDLLGCYLANYRPEEANDELRRHWSEHRVGNGVPDFVQIQRKPRFPDSMFKHKDYALIDQALVRQHGSVLIDGRTGSGKSTLTALWAHSCHYAGAGRIDLDMIDASDGAESVMSALLTIPKRAWYVVVMERVDTSLAKAQAVYLLVDRLRREHGYDIAVLANGWLNVTTNGGRDSSTIGERLRLPRGTKKIRTEPTKVFDSMVAGHSLDPGQIAALRECCGDGEDLVLAKLALDYVVRHSRVPSREEFTGHVAAKFGLDTMTDPVEREALYRFACLGMYEIEVPADEIMVKYARLVKPFVSRGLIEQADTTHRIGSRSVAREMARYAYHNWTDPNGAPLPSPAGDAAYTLRYAGSAQIQAALDRLDFISASRDGAPPAGRMLANAWKRRERIRRLMEIAVQEDHEWGDNVACAAFACMALRYLDLDEHWERCADWIRRRWDYETPGALPIWRGEKSAEKVDFQGMTESMSREDERLGKARAWPQDMRGDRIEPDRAHRTWMLGVLLCFEGTASKQDEDRLESLYESACTVQQPSGAFYPERVPWVTARVLIGLCMAGYGDTKAAGDAAIWLLHDSFQYGWKSGTGSWNTDIMTTAMSVVALIKQGVSPAEHQLVVGLAGLSAPTAQRTSEIDTALVVEAMLLSLSDPQARSTAYDLLGELLVWASQDRQWTANGEHPKLIEPERSGGEGESTKLPFVVSQLLPCIWHMVVNELATFFAEDFDLRPASIGAVGVGTGANGQQPVQHPVPAMEAGNESGAGAEAEAERAAAGGDEGGSVPGSTAPAGPDPEAVVRTRSRLDQIGAQLASDIESRRKAARTRNQQEHLAFFQNRLAALNELLELYNACLAEFDAGRTTEDLLRQVDTLGILIIGRSYEPIFREVKT